MNIGVLNAINWPTVENTQIDIDFSTKTRLPCGANRYLGIQVSTQQKLEILTYSHEILNYVSLDGKIYKKHLAIETQLHRYLMGARFEDQEIEDLDEDKMEIFPNLGRFEKRVGQLKSEKEVYVVNYLVNEEEWINLDDFVHKNGGLLNIPIFYHTSAPLYIIRRWARLIL